MMGVWVSSTLLILQCEQGTAQRKENRLSFHEIERIDLVSFNKSDPWQLYTPAPVEKYMIDHAGEFGWNETKRLTSTCQIWADVKATTVSAELQVYLHELDEYGRRVQKHPIIPDVRLLFNGRNSSEQDEICMVTDVDPRGLQGIFRSGQLSRTLSSGYLEPLLPPLRHPKFCMDGTKFPSIPFEKGVTLAASAMNFNFLMDLGYLVHDFGQICRQHKITSRNILIDMGASLNFHRHNALNNMAPIYLMEMFRKFGFPFDHIYAFEATTIPPQEVYARLPKEYRHSYHWINLPVSTDMNNAQNPLTLLLDNFNEDDLIVVKLDIDTPAVEMAMIRWILRDSRYWKLIDHFYFEHHVYLTELARNWIDMEDSVVDSLLLFQALRQRGIAAHYWP
jgi:hypothetical protein